MRSRTSIYVFAPVGLFLLVGYCFGFRPALARFEFSELHMGTQFKIILYCESSQAATLASNAFERIAQIDAITSDYLETSELMSICRTADGRKIRVSEDLFRVLEKSQEMAERSDGAFDVTIGPVVRLWRRARRVGELPDRLRLAQAMDLIGYRKLHLDRASRSVTLDRTGMLLDLGGIAKGYAVDEAMAVLKQKGATRALIAAGGDILVSGPPPGSQGWVIGIAPLERSNGPRARYLCLRDRAVSTSGDAHQHVEIGGVRYSHIVDPKTGLGLTGRSSVTVVAPNCAASDALATAASVLGPAKGSRLIESTPGAAALFIQTAEGDSTVETDRWNDVPKADPKEKEKTD
ncbi:MAG: FAD:protein FMN transferase [Acidobacteriota bacterium]